MARYIDADALIAKLNELKEEWGFTFTADGVEEAIFKVEEEPTADVVPKSEVKAHTSNAGLMLTIDDATGYFPKPFIIEAIKTHMKRSEVARCKDCVYFQPNFVQTNSGERRPYTEEEKNSSLGMVTVDVGVNCGSRCERFDYWEDNRFPVWFQENDYCSYFKKKYTEVNNAGE